MTAIELEGYGASKGTKERATVLREGNGYIFLGLAEGKKTVEIPFRRSDGMAEGSTPEGGLRIPPDILGTFNGKGKHMATKTKVTKTAPEMAAEPEEASPNGKGMAQTAEKTKKAGSTAITRKKSNAAAPTTTKAVPVESVEPPEVVIEDSTPAPAPAPAVDVTEAPAKRGPGRPRKNPEAISSSAQVTRRPMVSRATGKAALSPMLLAAQAAGIQRRKPQNLDEEFFGIHISPLMFRQIQFDHFSGGNRNVPGFRELRKAFDEAHERNYVYIVVDKIAAQYLIDVVFVRGFEGDWQGGLTGNFKRGARRTAAELARKFKLTVPEILKDRTPWAKVKGKPDAKKSKASPVPEPDSVSTVTASVPAPKRGPGRPKKTETAAGAPTKRGPGRPRKNPETPAAPVTQKVVGTVKKKPTLRRKSAG